MQQKAGGEHPSSFSRLLTQVEQDIISIPEREKLQGNPITPSDYPEFNRHLAKKFADKKPQPDLLLGENQVAIALLTITPSIRHHTNTYLPFFALNQKETLIELSNQLQQIRQRADNYVVFSRVIAEFQQRAATHHLAIPLMYPVGTTILRSSKDRTVALVTREDADKWVDQHPYASEILALFANLKSTRPGSGRSLDWNINYLVYSTADWPILSRLVRNPDFTRLLASYMSAYHKSFYPQYGSYSFETSYNGSHSLADLKEFYPVDYSSRFANCPPGYKGVFISGDSVANRLRRKQNGLLSAGIDFEAAASVYSDIANAAMKAQYALAIDQKVVESDGILDTLRDQMIALPDFTTPDLGETKEVNLILNIPKYGEGVYPWLVKADIVTVDFNSRDFTTNFDEFNRALNGRIPRKLYQRTAYPANFFLKPF